MRDCGLHRERGRGAPGRDDRRPAPPGPRRPGPVVGRRACRIGLGHRRLSIVDLESGDQPMWSADGELAVVFNGEIYDSHGAAGGAREARAPLRLSSLGHRGAAPRLPRVGRRLRRAPERHVGLRALRQAPGAAAALPGSLREEAPLLRHAARHLRLRVGADGAAAPSRRRGGDLPALPCASTLPTGTSPRRTPSTRACTSCRPAAT